MKISFFNILSGVIIILFYSLPSVYACGFGVGASCGFPRSSNALIPILIILGVLALLFFKKKN